MIELLFVSHQTNYDIIYIFLVVENFLHLFGNLSQHWLRSYMKVGYLLERPFSFKLTWGSEAQYAILCLLTEVIMLTELAYDILQEPILEKCFYMLSSLVYNFEKILL